MKKVLHLLSSNKFSGAENVVCQIINMYKDDNKYEMVYCSLDGPIKNTLKENNIIYYPLKKMNYFEVNKAIKYYNPDIIHAHDAKASILACIASKGLKIISHIHGNHDNMKKFSLKSILYYIISKKINFIFWVSNSSLEGYKYKNKIRNKSEVLYNVINLNELRKKVEQDKNEYNFDCIFLGRLCSIKDPIRLINILSLVKKELPDFKMVIIGDGELKEKCKKLVKQLNLSNNIVFMGYKSNPLKILHDSKIMIMTSKYEGTPMCALEAMSLGVPIVSTPTDGLCELIENNKTGFLSNKDEVLAKYIIKLIKNESLREEFSVNTKKRFTKLNDTNRYKERIENAYCR